MTLHPQEEKQPLVPEMTRVLGGDREFDELRIAKQGGFFGVTLPVTFYIQGADAQTAANFTTLRFLNAHQDRGYEVIRVIERHETAGTDMSAVTIMLKKVPDATAPASGTDVLTAGISLKGTANTNAVGTISTTLNSKLVKAGEGLTLVTTGTLDALVGVTVSVLLKAV